MESSEQPAQTRRKTRTFIIFSIVGLFVGSGLYLLLHWVGKLGALGQTGSNIAQVWSLPVAILELSMSIAAIGVAIWLHYKERPSGRDDSLVKIGTKRWSWWLVSGGVVLAVVAFFAPQAANSYYFHKWNTEDVTHSLTVKNGDNLKNGDSATIDLVGTKHRMLKLKLQLESSIDTGSCVAPARMTIDPSFGGDALVIDEVKSETSQEISLIDMNHKPQLKVSIDLKDEPSCSVNLRIAEAAYFR